MVDFQIIPQEKTGTFVPLHVNEIPCQGAYTQGNAMMAVVGITINV